MATFTSYLKNRQFVLSLIIGFILLALGLLANDVATNYSTLKASNSVTDIILSNTHVYDVDGIFVYGAILMVAFITLVGLSRPRFGPFILKSIALLLVIRSVFVSLTHISPFPEHVVLSTSYFTTSHFFQVFFTGDDQFFSNHTALPFLMALVFWKNVYLRLIFLALSIMFGIVVLLGHLHYSIDVLSAFFITYSIFEIAKIFFKKDWVLFNEGISAWLKKAD